MPENIAIDDEAGPMLQPGGLGFLFFLLYYTSGALTASTRRQA
jgi:hypothetical protein